MSIYYFIPTSWTLSLRFCSSLKYGGKATYLARQNYMRTRSAPTNSYSVPRFYSTSVHSIWRKTTKQREILLSMWKSIATKVEKVLCVRRLKCYQNQIIVANDRLIFHTRSIVCFLLMPRFEVMWMRPRFTRSKINTDRLFPGFSHSVIVRMKVYSRRLKRIKSN